MKRILLIVLAVLVLAIGISYWVPAERKSFQEIFTGEPTPATALLDSVRAIPLSNIEVDGRPWSYLVMGEGDRTVLFLHGMAGAYDIWWQQLGAFAKDYRVISLTYPPVQSLEDMAKAVTAILDQEKVGKVIVIGSSLGGYFGQFLLATRPDRIEQAVFGNTFPPNDVLEAQNKAVARWVPWLPDWLVMKVLRGGLQAKTIPASGNDPLVSAYLLEGTYGKMSKDQFYARYRCVVDKFTAREPSVPVLLIESDNDPLVPEELRSQLRAAYPQADVLTFHEGGHFPYINRADEYNITVRQFLEGELD
ncbi:MAG: alpha/beta hydrolase [Cyclobacteriaceae bacterium]